MYAIHTTPGFIIDSRPFGEAGKLLSIFTRELGLVMATAQGLRFEKSKLRYHTTDYSFGIFSFVKGKEFWRLTSAQAGEEGSTKYEEMVSSELPKPISPYSVLRTSINPPASVPLAPTSPLFVRIAVLLRRFLHGEESNPELFDAIIECRNFVEENTLDDEQLKTVETILVLRILYALGYIGTPSESQEFVSSSRITPDLLKRGKDVRAMLNQHINKALKESHL